MMHIIPKELSLFIKIKPEITTSNNSTDVIKKDKEELKYKHILNIIRTIHVLFAPKKKTISNT